MENNPRKLLILTADAGFGHRTAANAVAAALEDLYGEKCQIKIVNPLEDRRTPFFLRDSQSDYDKIVRNMPELYRFGYDASDALLPSAIVESALTVLLYEVIHDIIRDFNPDGVLTTYPLYQAPLSAVLTIMGKPVPILVVVTDLVTVHRLWFNNHVDACLVPTEAVHKLALSYNIPEERIVITGIPVNPAFVNERRQPAELRTALGWRTDLTTLLAVGSRRVENLLPALNVVNHFGIPLQLVVVAGRDRELYEQLQQVEWHIEHRLYEYTENIPAMMKASDAVICKAGGLITTESLAAGLPMLFISAIPGQETGNAEHVIQNGAGDMALEPMEVLETLSHWMMDDQKLLHRRAENACLLGKPQAAFMAAKLLWNASEPNSNRRTANAMERSGVIGLLSRFHIRWQDNLLQPGKKEIQK
ncbi:MAG: hypothetical protein GYA17_01025 [Chloroflexi bacterium]|jgi:1,2-diacylglycerol 3-beta-galactosyltransferase|nr:glycosyltransferase [Anaerolineaceae bacterium]NMB86907.1 hypothetical protein [Chloroflexota bacterium]